MISSIDVNETNYVKTIFKYFYTFHDFQLNSWQD